MSDDHVRFEAIEALLRPEPNDDAGSTEAQLDAEFDAVMAFLDNIDPEQAAELDALAAHARRDLDLAAQHEDSPDVPPTPPALHLHLKNVIPGDGRNRRVGAASHKGSRVTRAVRLLGRAAIIVGLVGVALAVAWGLLTFGGAAAEAIADASSDGLDTTDLLATLTAAIHSLISLQHVLEWRRSGRADGEQLSWRTRRRRRR